MAYFPAENDLWMIFTKNYLWMIFTKNYLYEKFFIYGHGIVKNLFFDMFIINEISFNGYSAYSLYFTSLAAILFGVFVIIAKNPIISVLFLIGLFLSISGYLILAGLNFLGLSYLLVYVGAVSILFLFILMLINVRISELLIDSINSLPFVMIAASVLGIFLLGVLPYMYFNFTDISLVQRNINHVTSLSWDGYLAELSHITTIGNILYGSYAIWLIITSIILLLAMVGAIVITLKSKSINPNSDIEELEIFTTKQLRSGTDLLEIISELNSVLPQLSSFIDQFNTVVKESSVNVITDSHGNMEIDVDKNMPDDQAKKLGKKIGIIDKLILAKEDQADNLIKEALAKERKIKADNPEYVSQITDKVKEFNKLSKSYKH